MARLPHSRVVDVSLVRRDRFATAAGFAVALVLTPAAVAGQVDGTRRTKVFSSLLELAADYPSASDTYKAAAALFTQNPRPRQIKVGYRNPANPITDELNAIYSYDPDFYWIGHTAELRDTPDQRLLADWAETKFVLAGLDSNDVDTETASTAAAASIAEYIESKGYDRSFVFYHGLAAEHPALALIGVCAPRDFDRGNLRAAQRGSINPGAAYTAKFKRLVGVTALNKPSAIIQAATGFLPGIGIDAAQGHRANVYVNIGGLDMVVEGNVGSGAFIDEIHAGDWLVARTRENLLSTLANSDRVPYTNPGAAILTNAVDNTMRRAVAAGIIAGEVTDGGANYLPEYTIDIDRVENIPEAQRRNRIAPDIMVDFRYAGAFHYASASLIMRF